MNNGVNRGRVLETLNPEIFKERCCEWGEGLHFGSKNARKGP